MITTRAMPALLPAHYRRVASQATVKNDFADPLVAQGTACVAFDAQTSSATPAGSTPLLSSLPRSPSSSRGDARQGPEPTQSSDRERCL